MTVLPKLSLTRAVNARALPELRELVSGLTYSTAAAAAALTRMLPLVPWIAPLTVSVAVTVWMPAVVSVTPPVKVWAPGCGTNVTAPNVMGPSCNVARSTRCGSS